MKEIFENRDMGETLFHNVNLHGAEFSDVNLSEAIIHNANLGGLKIEDAYIKGMTVFGIRVDELIEAEMDRRDPLRVQLRMADRFDPECVRAVIARSDKVRADFIAWLRATNYNLLTRRLAPGQWSVIEIVRHLLFAEDLYTHRWLLRDNQPWCKRGLRPTFLDDQPGYADVGSQPGEDLEAILADWAVVHTCLLKFVASVTAEELRRDTSQLDFGQGTVGNVLQVFASHELDHIRHAEAIVRSLTIEEKPG